MHVRIYKKVMGKESIFHHKVFKTTIIHYHHTCTSPSTKKVFINSIHKVRGLSASKTQHLLVDCATQTKTLKEYTN